MPYLLTGLQYFCISQQMWHSSYLSQKVALQHSLKHDIKYHKHAKLFQLTNGGNVKYYILYSCILCTLQWLSQTIMARLVNEINQTNKALRRIGCEDMEIGGLFYFYFISCISYKFSFNIKRKKHCMKSTDNNYF